MEKPSEKSLQAPSAPSFAYPQQQKPGESQYGKAYEPQVPTPLTVQEQEQTVEERSTCSKVWHYLNIGSCSLYFVSSVIKFFSKFSNRASLPSKAYNELVVGLPVLILSFVLSMAYSSYCLSPSCRNPHGGKEFGINVGIFFGSVIVFGLIFIFLFGKNSEASS